MRATHRPHRAFRIVPVVAAAVLLLTACNDDADEAPEAKPETGGPAGRDGSGDSGVEALPGTLPEVIVADSYTTMDAALQGIAWSEGDRVTVVCPAIAEELRRREVRGTDVYIFNTFLCLTAVHAGLTGMDEGGVVVAELLERFDHPDVEAVHRNGVAAGTWARIEAGYRFVEDP